MKYVWILVAVVILVRIDLVLKFFDNTAKKMQTESSSEVRPGEGLPNSEVVPMDRDLAIKSTPRQIFISMLNDFQAAPDSGEKMKTLEYLRAHPTMFSDKIDTDLESSIYRLRSLVVQRDKETAELVLEMMKYIRGENLEMLKRFFSFIIDADMADFLTIYSKSSDINCMIITYLGDQLSVDERFNELSERLTVLETYLNREGIAPPIKLYGDKCLLILKMEVEKMRTPFAPQDSAVSSEPTEPAPPQESPTPVDPGSTP